MLPILVMCYNDSFHSALGTKPAVAFMGRDLNQPVLKETEVRREYTELAYAQKIEYILEKTHELVFTKIQDKVASNAASSRLAQGRVDVNFTIGQKELIYRPVIHPDSSYKITPH